MTVDESVNGRPPHEAAGSAPTDEPFFAPTEVPTGQFVDPNLEWLPPAADQPPGPPPPDVAQMWVPPTPASPAQPASHRRRRLLPRTLRWRLVTGVVALVVAIIAIVGGATYVALGSFLSNRLDQQVATRAASLRNQMYRCATSPGINCPLGTQVPGAGGTAAGASQTLWVNILGPDGSPILGKSNSADIVLLVFSDAMRASILNNPDAYRTVDTGGFSVRIVGQSIPTPGGNYVGIVGLSTGEASNTLNRLLLLEIAIGAGAVLLAFVVTSVGVKASLRPLNRVTNTALTVTAELSPQGAGLDRRVPVTEVNADTEVGQLAESVNTLLGAVETQFAARMESDQRIRQFMADASHELRTPLTSIRGYAELARMRRQLAPETGSQESDADALARIESEGNRMSRLVDDLLTLARGDIGAPLQTEPVDVAELIDDAVEGAQAAHPDRRFGTTSFPGIVVHGDHDQLLRVVRNLLTNAAVHTAAGRPIRVNATREAGQAIIRVIDSGPGLPPEQAAHVFERFWRSDASRARTSGGSGLGLAIVASIVAAHGGTVRFDSSVDAGSTVTVSLPAR